MEDIFQWCREGNALQVRVWLDDTEHDMNQGDDHGFSPLHWACKEGHIKIVEMLIRRGARINVTNMGDDTPLHLAAAHGHRPIVQLLLQNRVDVNFTNEHGNSPLHYACFWGYSAIAEDLLMAGALVSLANKDGDTPLDKTRGQLVQRLHELATQQGQDLKKIQFKDQSWLGLKTRIFLHNTITSKTNSSNAPLLAGETWRGRWQKNDIVAKILAVRECTPRIQRDFNEEFPKLRIFSHPNILPVYMSWGSLYGLLHGGGGGGAGGAGALVLDAAAGARLAHDVARAMRYLHALQTDKILPTYALNSKHIMIDEDLTARINMADCKFSFQEKGRVYSPAWMAPEALQKPPSKRNLEAADMWSFAILLWELATREIPFADLSPMECGMKIALEGLRVTIPPGISPHIAKLIKICMNEDPGKRPTFEMVIPILEKMKR
ncbi:hypothetical protein HF086_017721 [Spodoptera exigua]|uniref:Protein kinase domain-containing protein n=1 Tax=Spodoptera exigua TaxID=7107 RepID=A0A922M3Z6_SPOEX|nr:hypothetical protein HF086_017721 [Spodoptera exigua]